MMRIYVFIQFSRNPFYDPRLAVHSNFYMTLSVLSTLILAVYVIFYMVLTKKALDSVKHLNPAYRFAFGVTIFVTLISAVILFLNGQAAQRIDSILFMSFYSLVNLYI